MIVEQIFRAVVAERFKESSYHVDGRGLKQKKSVPVDFSDFSADFTVERKQKSIVVHIGPKERIWIFPEVPPCRFIDHIVADYILLTFEVLDNFQPHFDEFIVHSILISEKVMREANHIIADVVFEEGHL